MLVCTMMGPGTAGSRLIPFYTKLAFGRWPDPRHYDCCRYTRVRLPEPVISLSQSYYVLITY